jgi:hypothetical protein
VTTVTGGARVAKTGLVTGVLPCAANAIVVVTTGIGPAGTLLITRVEDCGVGSNSLRELTLRLQGGVGTLPRISRPTPIFGDNDPLLAEEPARCCLEV